MSTLALPQVVEYGDSAIMVTVDSPDADLRQRRVVELRDAFTSHRPQESPTSSPAWNRSWWSTTPSARARIS